MFIDIAVDHAEQAAQGSRVVDSDMDVDIGSGVTFEHGRGEHLPVLDQPDRGHRVVPDASHPRTEPATEPLLILYRDHHSTPPGANSTS